MNVKVRDRSRSTLRHVERMGEFVQINGCRLLPSQCGTYLTARYVRGSENDWHESGHGVQATAALQRPKTRQSCVPRVGQPRTPSNRHVDRPQQRALSAHSQPRVHDLHQVPKGHTKWYV